jgi:Tfp pilus assembly protein PilE
VKPFFPERIHSPFALILTFSQREKENLLAGYGFAAARPANSAIATSTERQTRLSLQLAGEGRGEGGPRRRTSGYLLLELMVFMAMMLVILGLAYAAYWRCADNSKRLHENADDILAAVQAGERWRDDIRLAQDVVASLNGVHLIQAGDTIEYRFEKQCVWRRSARTGQTMRLLSKVKTSSMRPEDRPQVRAWWWEVELTSHKAPPFLHPLFTFEAVSAQ